jgi:hypothetical protein
MPTRSNATKKKNRSPIHKATARGSARPRTNSSKAGVYISLTGLELVVSSEKPKGTSARGPFSSVNEARSAALDELLAAIEAAERRLAALKRATTLEQLRAASSAS